MREDPAGGVADDLTDAQELRTWVDARRGPLAAHGFPVDEPLDGLDDDALAHVLLVRRAIRALFARAVRPGPPSPADAGRLIPVEDAVAVLDAAVRAVPVIPELHWPTGSEPTLEQVPARGTEPGRRLAAALARAAQAFLVSPQRTLLRACTAPRCVRYFVKENSHQEWCKPSCGNRARVARHKARKRAETSGTTP